MSGRHDADFFARFEKTRSLTLEEPEGDRVSSAFSRRHTGVGFALNSSRVIVIRATFLLTLALTVATGETAIRICQAVCDRARGTDTDACRHAQSAVPVSMTGDADCLGLGLPATASLRVELDRPDSRATTPAAANEPLMTTLGRTLAATSSSLPAGSPPRADVLRI
jgi:hypothetical protein